MAVIDPIRNFNSGDIDLHLPVYPGADLPVALAMIRLWNAAGRLDRTFLAQHADGLGAAACRRKRMASRACRGSGGECRLRDRTLACVFADASPAVIRVGWGIERNQNGGQALAAVMAMPALLGKFGVRGGGYTLSNSGAAKLDTGKLFGADSPPAQWATRELNMSQLGSLLANGIAPPVKSLFVYDCNPVATAPDQNSILRGLAREDLFTVVHEQSDDRHRALCRHPAPGGDVSGAARDQTVLRQLHHWRVQPAIEPCGEARPNEWVFARLGRAGIRR